MIESWRNVPGYNGKYQVDREGNIRRVFKSGKTRAMCPYSKKMSGSQRLVVKLTDDNGISKECVFMAIMARTFLGPAPKGHIAYHRNGCQSDNYINNIAYISRQELGKKTGPGSRRKAVAKINANGEVVEVYSSAREAAKKNFMSYQTIDDRCNNKCKSAFAPDGFAYAWEDSEVSMRHALRKIEMHNGYMPKANAVEFDF